MARIVDEQPKQTIKDRVAATTDSVKGSQAWSSIFRPGSIFRKGYTDSPRNRSYVVMNSVLYHLHPVKVKRHAVKVSYTLCLGGLSFFLFILLTVTGIFLMFFYRPESTVAWDDISNLQTSVTFGLLVRNMHRWGAHLMVLSVFLHRRNQGAGVGLGLSGARTAFVAERPPTDATRGRRSGCPSAAARTTFVAERPPTEATKEPGVRQPVGGGPQDGRRPTCGRFGRLTAISAAGSLGVTSSYVVRHGS